MDALLWDHSINEDAKEVPQGLKPEEEIARFSVRGCSRKQQLHKPHPLARTVHAQQSHHSFMLLTGG